MAFEKICLSNNNCKAEQKLFAIILAGDRPRRQHSADQARNGTIPPEPYVKFIDDQSMFELTMRRAKKVIPSKRIFVVVNHKHLAIDEVQRQVNERAHHTVLTQPRAADTVAGLFLALIRVYKLSPDATVTVFPADHFVASESIFLNHLRLAWHAIESDAEICRIMLLGMEPHSRDSAYCYIVPGPQGDDLYGASFSKIALVAQAPNSETTQKLIDRGALWHSGIIVAKSHILIDVVRQVFPALYESYQLILESSEDPEKSTTVFENICRDLPPMNFAHILRSLPWNHRRRLLVLPVRGVYWSELSNENRREECLEKMIGVAATTRLASNVA